MYLIEFGRNERDKLSGTQQICDSFFRQFLIVNQICPLFLYVQQKYVFIKGFHVKIYIVVK